MTPMNQLIIKGISSKFNILQMTGDKTIVIDKNAVVTFNKTLFDTKHIQINIYKNLIRS